MPIYEYICKSCGASQEHLIRDGHDEPECRECASSSLKRKLSVFAVSVSQSEPASCACGKEMETSCCMNKCT